MSTETKMTVEQIAQKILGTNFGHYSAPPLKPIVDELIAAVRSEQDEKWREKMSDVVSYFNSSGLGHSANQLTSAIEEMKK